MATSVMTTDSAAFADLHARTPVGAGRQRRRRRRPAAAVPLPWSCDNCAEPNEGRRRRCRDCGTTRL